MAYGQAEVELIRRINRDDKEYYSSIFIHFAHNLSFWWNLKDEVPESLRRELSVPDLTPATMEALRIHRRSQAEEKLHVGQEYRDKDLIFCQEDGRPLDADNLVKRVFKTTLKEAGIRTSLRFHDLRYTSASLLIAQGESPKYIQRQMRHTSISTTFNVYGHLMPEVHQRAGKKLDSALFGTSM